MKSVKQHVSYPILLTNVFTADLLMIQFYYKQKWL